MHVEYVIPKLENQAWFQPPEETKVLQLTRSDNKDVESVVILWTLVFLISNFHNFLKFTLIT